MNAPIPFDTISNVLSLALKKGIFENENSCVIFYDMTGLDERLREFKSVFPSSTLHAIAMKANPLLSVQKIIAASGFGSEVASLPELKLAEKAGFPASHIVFDSPVKTIEELRYALSQGVHINVDSFGEIERIAQIRDEIASNSTVGIRINPQVATGKTSYTVTAGSYSKFGVALKENQEKLLAAYLQYPWLNAMHVHIGSQACSPEVLVNGIGIITDFALLVNKHLEERRATHRIWLFDIGGGLPATYERDQAVFGLKQFRDLLAKRSPSLFDGTFKLITEYGRYLHANLGWAASRVEYVKEQCEARTALIHVGADLMLRKCYNPDDWHYDLFLADKEGRIKEGIKEEHVIAGPLCFSGDIIDRKAQLPKVEQGDYVVICDIGAYTFSMWSRYNSRPMPKIVGYNSLNNDFETLKERESIEQIIAFWT